MLSRTLVVYSRYHAHESSSMLMSQRSVLNTGNTPHLCGHSQLARKNITTTPVKYRNCYCPSKPSSPFLIPTPKASEPKKMGKNNVAMKMCFPFVPSPSSHRSCEHRERNRSEKSLESGVSLGLEETESESQ